MSELIHYHPGEAIRWLDMGSDSLRDEAIRKTKDVMGRRGDRTLGKDVTGLLSAVLSYGKGAMADLAHRQAQAGDYLLDNLGFESRNGRMLRRVNYADVKAIRRQGDRVKFILAQGSLEIKPYAYIVAGRTKVPVGWARNDMEVPYELLIEELAAHCQLEVEDID